ncbi:metallophosphoesterase family protein [Roseospira goensis]|uniref:DNA repair exonuclease SbcCD nuclease subunit n=1 Tax=Roseospira goensis TaxID=391922 RepID=A0A7W6RZT5_9PROT|nr:DNA repair exonuclease [Roseospira goensis]MBB4286117.1 DNA repair exonuclease SbcCD nuclease subunit [Roseospira goensis]
MPFRFVHTADIHLDSPLRSLALRDPDLAEMIGTATRTAFARTVDLCLEERVDALFIVGDLYDGAQTSMKTAAFLAGQLARLDEAGIRSFIVRGNHDAESRITRELVLPDGVTVFRGSAEAHRLPGAADGRDVAVHGISFARPQAPDSLLPKFRPAVADALNIGLLHTSLGGAAGHDTYAPCAVADLVATGFDYWGLGHVHTRTVHHPARPAVVMPGQPQGRDINEAGLKTVTLATLAGDGTVTLEARRVSVAEFARVPVAADGRDDWADVVATLADALAAARAAAASDHLVVRLAIAGATPLAWRLRVDTDLLLAEARACAERVGQTWVETVECAAHAPRAAATGDDTDPVAELRGLIADEVTPSDGYRAEAERLAAELRGQLPRDIRAALGADEAAFAALVDRLIAEGTEDVLARLHAGTRDGGEGA